MRSRTAITALPNVAPTIVTMMGLETPDCWQPSMI